MSGSSEETATPEAIADKYRRILQSWATSLVPASRGFAIDDDVTFTDVAIRHEPGTGPDDSRMVFTVYYKTWSGSALQWRTCIEDEHDAAELMSTLLKELFALATPEEL